MSARDRLVLMAIGVVAILGGAWMLEIKPLTQQASTIAGEVTAARTQLTSVQHEISEAQGARQRYRAAYAALATLGIAVPTSSEVPALMYTIDHAANNRKVEFTSISNGGSSGSGSSSTASGEAAGFKQLPLTFAFNGSYKDLIKFVGQLENFTVEGPSETLQVSGRLLTIQSITFSAPQTEAAGSSAHSSSASGVRPGEMTWSISATAYVLPPAPAAHGAPAGGTSGGAQPTSGGASSGSSASGTPAVVRATP